MPDSFTRNCVACRQPLEHVMASAKCGGKYCKTPGDDPNVGFRCEKQMMEHWKRFAAAMISRSVPHSPSFCIFITCCSYVTPVDWLSANHCCKLPRTDSSSILLVTYALMSWCCSCVPVTPRDSARNKQLLSPLMSYTVTLTAVCDCNSIRCLSALHTELCLLPR